MSEEIINKEQIEETKESKITKHELLQVRHIGPKTLEKLLSGGINTVADLAVRRPEEISAILEVNLLKAKEIINSALEIAWNKVVRPYTLSEYKEWYEKTVKKIPTGSTKLDTLLKGGIRTSCVTTLAGSYGTGKTEICKQVAVNALRKYNLGTIWVETEPNTFSFDRIEQMAKAYNLKINYDSDFHVFPAKEIGDSPNFVYLTYLKAEEILEKNPDRYGVFVVDSFSAKFRGYFQGREMLSARNQETARHFAKLNMLAAKYNLAVLLTCHVMDIPVPELQIMQRAKTGAIQKMWGGTYLEHMSTILIYLRKASSTEWSATVVDAPDIPRQEVMFKITEIGVRD